MASYRENFSLNQLGSANANFYFATTLSAVAGAIFLITDSIFAELTILHKCSLNMRLESPKFEISKDQIKAFSHNFLQPLNLQNYSTYFLLPKTFLRKFKQQKKVVEFRAMSSLLEQLPKSKEDSPKIVFTPYKDETEMRKGLTNLISEFLITGTLVML